VIRKRSTALLPLVYNELRRVAHFQLQRERPDHTLQSTALVHEAYLRLLGNTAPELHGRSHFVAISARLIRQILVDYARDRAPLSVMAVAAWRSSISTPCQYWKTLTCWRSMRL
jgi:hypothetical protein